LSEVEASCSRVVVIARGKLVAAGTVEELAKKRRSAGLVLVVRGDGAKALAAVRAIEGIAEAKEERQSDDGARTIRCTWKKDIEDAAAVRATEEAVSAVVAAGCFVREARPINSTLEELFAELTR